MSLPPKILLPGTSPTKPQKFTKTDVRPERSLAAHEVHAVVATDSFQTTFINFPDPRFLSATAKEVSTLVSKVKGAKNQAQGYQRIPALLNEIARLLEDEYEYPSVIHFVASPTQPPQHHPCGNQDTPDFLGMSRSSYDQLGGATPPWHYLVSLGEWKPGKTLTEEELSQTGAYAGSLNQAKPDNPCALVFSACPGCYVIGYSDPSIWTTSEFIPWKNLNPLIAFIHTLHQPKVDISDSTITLVAGDISQPPRWNIHDAAFDINDDFEIIHVGRAHSRMTTVFRCVQAQNLDPLLVKDAWIKSYRKPELVLFNTLSSDGPPPGWVNVRTPTKERVQLQTGQLAGITQRKKDRTVIENTGIPFESCRSLSDAIAVTYDILEANRWAITKHRILHRDVSAPNILISPVVGNAARDGAYFIKSLLSGATGQPSSAILLDLDNGITLGPEHLSLENVYSGTDESSNALRELSGTPMYIARGPSIGVYLLRECAFPTLPILTDPISQLYVAAYPGDTLRSATGPVGTFSKDDYQNYKGKRVIQRPWHDAESTMFTLLLFLLRCSPEGSPKESQKQLEHMQYLYSTIRSSGIRRVPDPRNALLLASETEWNLYLHEGLQGSTNFICEICSAVTPDYEFLQPSTNSIDVEVVLHEVLQRLLLQWYYDITITNPELDITFSENLRPVPFGQAKSTIVVPAIESRGKYTSSIERDVHRAALEAGLSGAAGFSGMSGVVEDIGPAWTGAGLDPGTSRMGPVFGHDMEAGTSASHSRPVKHKLEDPREQIVTKKKRKKTVSSTSGLTRQSDRLMGRDRPCYNEDLELEEEEEQSEVRKGKRRRQ